MRRVVAVAVALVLTTVLVLVLAVPATANWREMGNHHRFETGEPITIEQARERAETFLAETGYSTLITGDAIEFTNHFYVQVVDSATGSGALELVVSRDGAVVHPAPGPGMLWNTSYSLMRGDSAQSFHTAMMGDMHQRMGGDQMHRGMMPGSHGGTMNHQAHGHGGQAPDMMGMESMMSMCPLAMVGPSGGATLDEPLDTESASVAVQAWLDASGTGTIAAEPFQFPGYYTARTLNANGQPVGLVSINTDTGQVWEHAWHGTYVQVAPAT
jgi:hypothetical protein